MEAGEATARLQCLSARIAPTPIQLDENRSLACTVSVGAAEHCAGQNAQSLIARADRHLYLAKRQGRNRVVAGDVPPSG